ncbi:MAG: AraC family transcriptional regulator [Marinilabiliaceae bacterium]|nr:AraC family transcriptional regulator [Marinilabiliaceae bacterium]
MKPQKEYLSANIMHSFRVKHTVLPFMDSLWHYHPDFELIYTVQGSGKRFVGDSIENFYPGDLVFLGANLPHVWKNDEMYHQGNKNLNAEVIVIQFKKEVFGAGFFLMPELNEINQLLVLSQRGIKITGETKERIVSEMWKILNLKGIRRISGLLTILDLMTRKQDQSLLISPSYKKVFNDGASEKLNKVFDYVATNFQSNIKLDEVADIASMSKTAFCRFFKSRTTKTFQEYLTDVRISYACELLMEADLNITQISEKCGFNSHSFFNRQFKALKGETPSAYSHRYRQI